ncbi:hypothetical protein NQ317_008423 [Molorchus minor]|uniref:Uncharacterized protein n=1 Tax=Molorchus minor TaxID=1323400 RepID=A0ABQ9JGP8_9CUCU|nr:hypothetical protein NQ317_008423 [Molorchus minor]
MNALIRITRHVQLKGTNLNFLRYLNYQKISNSFIPLTPVSCINNSWIYQRNQPEIPLIIDGKIDLPNNIKIKLPLIDEPITKKEIEAPATANSDISKQTARLIVIRRKKNEEA